MSTVNVQITNLPEIRAAFRMAPLLMKAELNKAIRKTALNIKAKEVGNYSSMGIGIVTRGLISAIQRGTYFGELSAEVGPNVTGSPGVSYSVYVHDGTRYLKSRPFLKEAVDDAKPDSIKFFEEAVQDVLNRIGDKV
jgi:HK97 gp10 family phage protein